MNEDILWALLKETIVAISSSDARKLSEENSGMYKYIPSDIKYTSYRFKIAFEYFLRNNSNQLNFIECGSGFPILTLSAYYIYNSILRNLICKNKHISKSVFTAIEYDEKLYALGKHLMPYTINLVNGDIMDQDYSKYNFVYFYCPMRNVQKEIAFEKKLVTELKSGAIIIPSLPKYIRCEEIPDLKKISKGPDIFVKE